MRLISILCLTIFLIGCTGNVGADSATLQTEVFEAALLTATFSIKDLPTPMPVSTNAEVGAQVTPIELPILPTRTEAAPTVAPTATAEPSPTIALTPPALPELFSSGLVSPANLPAAYEKDTCTYLKNKWDPNKSQPGTVVMPIMFHSITDGVVTSADQISVDTFAQLVHDLRQQGFEAISMQQFVDFTLQNAKIPARSVLLIVDDRKTSQYFETHFRSLYNDFGWVVINAWISFPETSQQLWDENAELERAGYVDHQAHGVIHNINMTADQTDEFIKNELYGSIEAMQSHFNKTPIAIIWPGGNFSKRAIEIAQEAGYQVGFTVNPRGPVMYNWVPQGDPANAESRASYHRETAYATPLLTLPRYWDTDASLHIDTVRQVAGQAREYAEANKQTELQYYDIVCSPQIGPIPAPIQ